MATKITSERKLAEQILSDRVRSLEKFGNPKSLHTLIDSSGAFHIVDYEILQARLEQYGDKRYVLLFMQFFLERRKQYVKYIHQSLALG